MEELKNIIESLLFISDDPLSLERIKTTLPEMEPSEIKAALTRLVQEYETRNGGITLIEVAGGYQFRTNPTYREWVTRLVKPSQARLSKASLETLAIIAYRQPIMRTDIEHIRGVDSGGVLRMLMERKLIRVLGRKEIPGRPLIYATTKEFLEVFGLNDLKDLPSLKEIESFSRKNEGTPNPFADQQSAGDLLNGRTPEAEALAEQLPESERPPEYAIDHAPTPHETECGTDTAVGDTRMDKVDSSTDSEKKRLTTQPEIALMRFIKTDPKGG